MEDKIIGVCGLDPRIKGCNTSIYKNDLVIFNDAIKEKLNGATKDKAIIRDKEIIIIGWCENCQSFLYPNDIEDNEIRLILEL